MVKKKRCSNCGYVGKCGADRCCDYILIEKHCRPCPASDGCAAWRSKAEVNKRKAMMDEIAPIVPTANSMKWARAFQVQEREVTRSEWKSARQRERAAAIAQLELGTKQRREMEAPR